MVYQNLLFLFLAALGADTENNTVAGKFVVEHPTLLNLGFEWEIRGDANRNATVAVQFRAAGESGWRQALPLVRIGGENVYRRRENLDYTVPEGVAVSISQSLKGTKEEAITIKSARDEEVGFKGSGYYGFFDVIAAKYYIFDCLTICNCDVENFACEKEVVGAVGLSVKNCRFENV